MNNFNMRTIFLDPCLNMLIFPCIIVTLLDLVRLRLLYK